MFHCRQLSAIMPPIYIIHFTYTYTPKNLKWLIQIMMSILLLTSFQTSHNHYSWHVSPFCDHWFCFLSAPFVFGIFYELNGLMLTNQGLRFNFEWLFLNWFCANNLASDFMDKKQNLNVSIFLEPLWWLYTTTVNTIKFMYFTNLEFLTKNVNIYRYFSSP